jgi:phosphatidylserine/phosphatidylglycerophosphate/cardiolipin synthase-like enzyme
MPRLLVGRLFRRLAHRHVRHVLAPIDQRRHRRSREADRIAAVKTRAHGVKLDDAHWYRAGTPPRRHNRVLPLIHGDRYFADLLASLATAQHYVFVIGWCLTPDLPLCRDSRALLLSSRVKDVLAETARRVPVRVLLWSGAPYLFKPDTEMVEDVQRELEATAGTNFQCRLDRTARFSHCHHQKAVVIDGQFAYLGGIDLSTFQGDRWDTAEHALRAGPNWHDAQVRIEGDAVADVEENFRQRWREVTGENDLPRAYPRVDPSWQAPVQIVRTIPKQTYGFAPRGEYGIHHAYIHAIRGANRFIYIENQYLWSPEIVEALIAALEKRRDDPFRIVIMLPARAYDGKWDNDQRIQKLRDADDGRGMVAAYCPYASGPSGGRHAFSYRPTYVHAKVMIVDDEWVTIGSANLNDRGLLTDGEIMALIHDGDVARNLRIELWAEHLGMARDTVASIDAIALIDAEWPERANQNAGVVKRGSEPLFSAVHRYEAGRMPGALLLEEVEAVTLEH